MSRDVFTRRQLLKALRWYLFIDIARAYQLAHELFTRPVTDLFDVASRGYLERCANVAALLGPWLGTLAMDYYLFSAAHVKLGWSAPGDWPDVYGKWADAYTVRRFWGSVLSPSTPHDLHNSLRITDAPTINTFAAYARPPLVESS